MRLILRSQLTKMAAFALISFLAAPVLPRFTAVG